MAALCCEYFDVESVQSHYGPASATFASEVFLNLNLHLPKIHGRTGFLKCYLNSVQPRWLAARVADQLIRSYDVTLLTGEGRQLLMKPLSLLKIVRQFEFITVFTF